MTSRNKVIYVESKFKPLKQLKTFKVPTGDRKKGFFGIERDIVREEQRWVQVGWSDSEVDGERLAQDLESAIFQLNSEGYQVVSVTPVSSGKYDYQWNQPKGNHRNSGSAYGFGYGFSYTEGLTIIAKSNEC